MKAIKLILLAIVVIVAAMGANFARDLAYQIHALLIMAIAFGLFIWTLRNVDEPATPPEPETGYMDGVVRAGVIATEIRSHVPILCGKFFLIASLKPHQDPENLGGSCAARFTSGPV